MPFDFSDLKSVSLANGEVTLRIPRRWDVVPHESDEGRWGCYEEEVDGVDPDTGTLWISVDHYIWRGEGAPPPGFDVKSYAEQAAARTRQAIAPLLADQLTDVEDGLRWFRSYDVEEDGEPLRFWFSHFFLGRERHVAVISFNLVLTHAQMDDPEFVELREIIEREIANAFLDPFKSDDWDAAEEALAPMHLCNFADWVKVSLPEAIGFSFDEEADEQRPRWYGRLETETSHAAMFVECQKMSLRDEDGDPVNLPAEMYREVLDDVVGEPGGEDRYRRMPAGVVAVDTYEDTEGIGETDENGRVFQGCRNRVWRYMVFGEGQAQLLTVLLIVPLPEWDRVSYAALRNYLDGAVRRAEFPGFEPTARF